VVHFVTLKTLVFILNKLYCCRSHIFSLQNITALLCLVYNFLLNCYEHNYTDDGIGKRLKYQKLCKKWLTNKVHVKTLLTKGL